MSNIINVKEERNVLSFAGEVFNLVANSTNFYLKFELDNEWDQNSIITVIFNFDGKYEYVELDENRMCQIPPTTSSRIWFCITTEPDETSKLSSTILSLDVEQTGDTNLSNIEVYENVHKVLLGLVQKLLDGDGVKAEFAKTADFSKSQVSLTGNENISGEKNFVGKLMQNSNIVLDSSQIAKPNLVMNSNFRVNQRGLSLYTRNGEDIYTADRWYLSKGNGSFNVTTKTLTGADEISPTVLCQWIEDTEYLTYGKPLTVSVTINGERMCFSTRLEETYEFSSAGDAIVNLYEGEGFVVRIYVKPTSRLISLQFLVENGVSITIEKIKLEISEFATKYEELQLHEELLECSRYYQKILPAGAGYALNDTTVTYFVPLAVPLRTMRNLVVSIYPKVIVNGVLTSTSNLMSTRNENNAIALAVKDIFVTKHQAYNVVNGTVFIDAEFYVWLKKF